MPMQIFLGVEAMYYGIVQVEIYIMGPRASQDLPVSVPNWAQAPVIHAASHFYHEKRVAWVSIFMHACDPVPIVMGLRSVARRAAGAPLLIFFISNTDKVPVRYLQFCVTVHYTEVI